MITVTEKSNLQVPIEKANFDLLLNGSNFIFIRGQLLYKYGSQYVITNIDNDKFNYTVEDYMKLPEGAPFQLINGKLIYMPSPFDIHQKISSSVHTYLFFHVLNNNLGQVRAAPLDVHFSKTNIYQPDILFVSNQRSHIIKDYIRGAPDLVVEILSKGTRRIDEVEKMKVYGQYNVLEYWIIDPEAKILKQYLNENHKMVLKVALKKGEVLTSNVLTGFEINLNQIF